MNEDQKPTTGTISTVKKYFGLKDGQTMTEFAKEYKELTDEDKAQLAGGILDGTETY